MKLEIEITEDEIKSAIERKIRVALSDVNNSLNADIYIKEQVRKYWKDVADKAVKNVCEDEPELRKKIMAALENKIKGQLTAVLKAGVK